MAIRHISRAEKLLATGTVFAAGLAMGATAMHAIDKDNAQTKGKIQPDLSLVVPPENVVYITAQPEETYWQIAKRYANKNSEIRDDVDELIKDNGAELHAGQQVRLEGELADNYVRQQAEAKTPESNGPPDSSPNR